MLLTLLFKDFLTLWILLFRGVSPASSRFSGGRSFLDKYPLVGVKVKDFEDFKRVAELMNSKGHLTKEGLEAIRKIKQGMNTSRSAAVQHEQSSAQDMRK
jgi:hypothetical protein